MDERPSDLPPIIQPQSSGAAYEPAVSEAARPWGFWATIGWTLLIGLAWLLAQAAVLILWKVIDREVDIEQLATDGLVLGVATIVSAPVAIGLCLLFAKLRTGIRVREYLALRWPGWQSAARWAGVVVGFVVASDLLTTVVLREPLVPDVMVEVYENARFLPVLWIALVIAAPLSEEIVFRGFLFAGLAGRGDSRWRNSVAVLVTSGIWALIHVQYDFYGIATIFVFGIVLGCARLRTGSVLLCILLHALMNLIVTVEVELLPARE